MSWNNSNHLSKNLYKLFLTASHISNSRELKKSGILFFNLNHLSSKINDDLLSRKRVEFFFCSDDFICEKTQYHDRKSVWRSIEPTLFVSWIFKLSSYSWYGFLISEIQTNFDQKQQISLEYFTLQCQLEAQCSNQILPFYCIAFLTHQHLTLLTLKAE